MDLADLLSQTAIRAWAISCIVIALKTMLAGTYTSILRMRKQVFISPEDYKMLGGKAKSALDPEIERARRVHQNDLENGLPFALVGLVYALTGPSAAGIWICFAGFPIATRKMALLPLA